MSDVSVDQQDAASEPSETELRCGTISLVGETNAGKSTLLNALLREKVSIVSPKPHTTRHRVLGVMNREQGQLVFVDTPGFTKAKSSNELAKFVQRELRDGAQGVDVTVLVLDVIPMARGKRSVTDVIAQYSSRRMQPPAIVVLNKVDVVRKDILLPVIAKLSEELPKVFDMTPQILPMSALQSDGVEALERLLFAEVPKGPRLFPEDAVSDQTEEFFVSEIIREKIFLLLQQELPYSAAVQLDHWVDEDTLQRISARIIVERESQKAIVIGKGASRLKEIGQLARLELEKIFGCKVFLELLVRVEPEWTQSAHGLSRVGYADPRGGSNRDRHS